MLLTSSTDRGAGRRPLKQVVSSIAALTLALGLAVATPLATQATPPDTAGQPDFICPDYAPNGTDKIDTTGDPATVTYTAPAGYLVDYYCVKAGSPQSTANPMVIVPVDPPAATVIIDHPEVGSVSHYSVHLIPIPATNVIPNEPSFTDSVCEVEDTGTTTPTYTIQATPNVSYQVSTDGGSTYAPIAAGTYDGTIGQTIFIKAVAASGYVLTGYTGPWSHTFADPGDCLDPDTVTPAVPSFTDSVCEVEDTGKTTPTYTIQATPNVSYQVSTDGGSTYAPIAAGTHDGTIGQTIFIKAVAASGYVLTGYTGPWSHTFADPGACLDPAPVDPVVGADQECLVDDLETGEAHYESGSITIPSTPHVTYFVNGVQRGAGTWPYAPGVYTITAQAAPGYELVGVPDDWKVEINAAKPCGDLEVLPSVTPTASSTSQTCTTPGSYTLGVEEEGLESGVIWTVSGGLPNTPGTHAVTSTGTVTVIATPAEGFGFPGESPRLEWTFTFAGLPDDCLETLALTGGTVAGGTLIGIWSALTAAGVIMIAARRRLNPTKG